MKKTLYLIVVLVLFSITVVTQASADCYIKWWGNFYIGPFNGSALTEETTRTQQATYEAFVNMFNKEPQDWSNGCYNRYDPDISCVGGGYFYYHVCQNGNWSKGQQYCVHKGAGNWDVVCGSDIDTDGDGVIDILDNCPNVANGPLQGSCFNYTTGQVWGTCTTTDQCRANPSELNIWCDNLQGDSDLDGIGDVCEPVTTTTTPQITTTTTIPPTLIELSSFTSTPKACKVLIQWSTEAEIDNAGFNIYRSTSENGEYIKINDALIPAQGSSTQGASYEYTDEDVRNRKTYYYKLEDIDLNGKSTMHGPVSATPRWILGIFGIFKK